MDPLGLVSAYHHHFAETFGKESRPTYFHQRKSGSSFHIDYCFLPESWADRVQNVEVGSYAKWGRISDHVPLIVDLEFARG